jgi:hypothetical protein
MKFTERTLVKSCDKKKPQTKPRTTLRSINQPFIVLTETKTET